jgi:hypothetical protein
MHKILVLIAFALVVAAGGVWAKSSLFTAKPAADGKPAVAASAAPMSPFDIMMQHGKELPVAPYAEPF